MSTPWSRSAREHGVTAWSTVALAVATIAYELAALSGGRIGVSIADVCGKGTPAALLMASAHDFSEGDPLGDDATIVIVDV